MTTWRQPPLYEELLQEIERLWTMAQRDEKSYQAEIEQLQAEIKRLKGELEDATRRLSNEIIRLHNECEDLRKENAILIKRLEEIRHDPAARDPGNPVVRATPPVGADTSPQE